MFQVSLARPNEPAYQRTNVLIRDMPDSWTEIELANYLSKFGSTVTIKVIRNKYTGT